MPLLIGIIAVVLIAVAVVIVKGNKKPSAPAKPNTTVTTTAKNTTKESSTAPTTQQQSTEAKSWKELYLSKIDELKYSLEDPMFASYTLYDMNLDGIPELIVDDGRSSAESMFSFYTVKNNQLISLGEHFSGDSHIEVSEGVLYAVYTHGGYQIINQITIFGYKIEAVKIYEVEGENTFRTMGEDLEFFEFDSEYSPLNQY